MLPAVVVVAAASRGAMASPQAGAACTLNRLAAADSRLGSSAVGAGHRAAADAADGGEARSLREVYSICEKDLHYELRA